MRARAIMLLIGIACASLIGCSDKKIDRDVPEPRDRRSSEPTSSSDALPADFPVIEIGANRTVRMDGVLAGDTTPMVELQQLQKLDELFNVLKEKRELWKSSRADKPFPGVAGVRVQPDTSGFALKSVMQTAAFAGYPTLSLQIIGAADIHDVTMQVPPPLEEEITAMHVTPKDAGFVVEWKIGSTVAQHFDVPADKLDTGICEAWEATSGKPRLFVAIVHFANETSARDLAKVLRALQRCTPLPPVELAIR